nr:beta-2 adrenergic receptor-like [Lytechinus pictus]
MGTLVGTDFLTDATVHSSPQSPLTRTEHTVTTGSVSSTWSSQGSPCLGCSKTTLLPNSDGDSLDFLSTDVTLISFTEEVNFSYPYGTSNSTSPEVSSDSGVNDLTRQLLVGILSILLALAIAFGNTLVILAVYREHHLRTVTNLFIVSLACADFLLGTIVLPFSIHMEITQGYWPYGVVWCDLWHAFDILGCTASILNLCVIACDRYWAITHPFSYPTRMTKRMALILISVAWVCSALISFPCIWWWHAVEPPHPPLGCVFPSNTVYLVTSSCVSFYVPSVIMLCMYLKIYRTAVGQVRMLRSGTKRVKSVNGDGMAMRVHKGGSVNGDAMAMRVQKRGSVNGYEISMRVHKGGIRTIDGSLQKRRASTSANSYSPQTVPGTVNRRNSLPGRKLMSRLSREHKAARTLGIVMGVFIICWLPFFIVNVTAPLCQTCYFHPILLGIVTWLGYVNSALNPIIYAFASRRFKNAFTRILCIYKWKRKREMHDWSSSRRKGSMTPSSPTGLIADTSITQCSEERNSVDTTSSAHSNFRYSLPNGYF